MLIRCKQIKPFFWSQKRNKDDVKHILDVQYYKDESIKYST